MATLAPLTTPARQPFGILNDSKIRSLQSVKNRQNAITLNSAPTSLKRRAPSPEADGNSDGENVDPNLLDSLHKRKRSMFDDDVSIAKSQRYSLNVTASRPSIKPLSRTPVVSTPRLDTFVKPSITPASAPAAGRSPTRKRSSGLLNPRKRFNPPAFSSKQSPSLSLSAALSAALSGTKRSRPSSRKARNATIETSKRKEWFFDIYEESEEVQDYRMNEWTMTQSATGLDISDDESKSSRKSSSSTDRGKENIDPNEAPSAPVTRARAAAAAAQAEEMEVQMKEKDEPRTPLGDLNPTEFYADGLDATSVILVHDDEEAETDVEGEDTQPPPPQHDFTFQHLPEESSTSSTSLVIDDLDAPSLAEILHSAASNFHSDDKAEAPCQPLTDPNTELQADADGDVDFGIWESESAKDENEKQECPGSPRSIVGDENAFALQEL